MFRRLSPAALLRNWFTPARPPRPARPRKAALSLERLEDRLVLDGTFQVTTLTDKVDGCLWDEITYANQAGGNATITFKPGLTGTIHMTRPLPDLSANITIQGPGADRLTVQRDGTDYFRFFHVKAGATVAISGFTLTGGDVRDPNGPQDGGAIENEGELTLTACTLSGNAAKNGGAIGNAANATLTVTDSTFSGNTATPGGGGAIDNQGTVKDLSNSTFSANVAGTWGGALYTMGPVNVTNSTFSANAAGAYGGGIAVNGGQVTLTDTTLTLNRAGTGSLLWTGGGGGIDVHSGTLTLDSTLVAGNSLPTIKWVSSSVMTMDVPDDVRGEVDPASSYNLIGTDSWLSGISDGDQHHNQVGPAASPLDPKLGSLADNGGPTFTHAPLNGSPALAAGDPAQTVTTDQRGQPRTVNGHVDVGAFQRQALRASLTGTPSQGSPEGKALTLGVTVTDPDPHPVYGYSWEVTLGGVTVATGSDPTLPFTPARAGTYDVKLKVTGRFGDTVTTEKFLVITNVVPTVSLGESSLTLTALDLSRNGSFTDPGSETWTATVDYGDGTGKQSLTLNADKTFSLGHHYSKGGTVTVTVDVFDGTDHGKAGLSVTVPAPLQGAAITGAPGDSTPEGTPLNLAASVIEFDANAHLSFRWQVTSNGATVASGTAPTFTFTPAVAGSCTVALTVTDQNGSSVSAQPAALTVTDVAPAVSLGSVSMQGVDLTGSGSFSDPGRETWTGTVDYGDGTGSQSLALNADKTFSLSHHYARGGAYTVTVDVSDGTDHGTAQAQVTAQTAVVPPANIQQVAHDFTHQDENFRNFIRGAYQKYLARDADQSGLDAWADQMENHGLSDERLEAGFIGSDEYIALHGGQGAGWVNGMYHDLLGRTPTDQEVNGWVNALNNGVSPSTVAYGFAASAEREGMRVQANYQTYLGRRASADEASGWVNDFTAGQISNEDMQAGFMASAEYYNDPLKGRGTNPDWVASVYQDVLARTATPDEVTTWAGSLQ
jgi:hypothetical protein